MIDLSGKTCVVTGAARSIGYAIAERFAESGASVALLDKDPEAIEAGVELEAKDLMAKGWVVDITDRNAVLACFDEIAELFGPVFCLVNNAGIVAQTPIEEVTEDELDRVFQVNVHGTFYCCQGALKTMRREGDGRIINFSSKSGKTGSPLMASYSAAKGAVIALTQSMAFELAADNIKVNCLCPGITDNTGVWENVSADYTRNLKLDKKQVEDKFTSKVPLRRLTTIEDLVEFTLFLATSADYCTGQAFNISGGREVH